MMLIGFDDALVSAMWQSCRSADNSAAGAADRLSVPLGPGTPVLDAFPRARETELRSLMTAGLEGDARAYRKLLAQLTAHLRAYFRRRFAFIGQGPTEAEDLLQEVLLAVHTRRGTYDRLQPFTPWVHAIARYKFVDHLRRTKSSIRDVPVESAEELISGNDLGAVESRLDLDRLLSRISFAARQAIRCVKLEGLSIREAAARCGMSESAVKVAVHRGLKALTARIGMEGEP
jgi:RNA polymerase sigma-70 factor, ECF subfamily